jgi:hypothetical protein
VELSWPGEEMLLEVGATRTTGGDERWQVQAVAPRECPAGVEQCAQPVGDLCRAGTARYGIAEAKHLSRVSEQGQALDGTYSNSFLVGT